jgi:hypothetical protein
MGVNQMIADHVAKYGVAEELHAFIRRLRRVRSGRMCERNPQVFRVFEFVPKPFLAIVKKTL